MIARLLICPSLNILKEEITQSLYSHFRCGNTNHPDLLYIRTGEKLGIAEARKIKEHFFLKPYSAKGRAAVLEDASTLTAEAQNALLKTIEELPEEAVLILGAGSDAGFLPTILSRCEIVNLKTADDNIPNPHHKYIKDIEGLLNSSTEERFAYVEKLKDRDIFLHALVYYFRQQLLGSATHAGPRLEKLEELLKKLLQAEEWSKQNVNIRAILEYLMLVMPEKSQNSNVKT